MIETLDRNGYPTRAMDVSPLNRVVPGSDIYFDRDTRWCDLVRSPLDAGVAQRIKAYTATLPDGTRHPGAGCCHVGVAVPSLHVWDYCPTCRDYHSVTLYCQRCHTKTIRGNVDIIEARAWVEWQWGIPHLHGDVTRRPLSTVLDYPGVVLSIEPDWPEENHPDMRPAQQETDPNGFWKDRVVGRAIEIWEGAEGYDFGLIINRWKPQRFAFPDDPLRWMCSELQADALNAANISIPTPSCEPSPSDCYAYALSTGKPIWRIG